jgi:hypothetical protein
MRVYSYVHYYDGGFAPTVQRGLCTLACCKPQIRRKARPGDWVLGTTPRKHGLGRLSYLMKVQRVLEFNEYRRVRAWRQRNDNIYRVVRGRYVRKENRWHGPGQMRKDLGGKYVLMSRNFVYFGNKAPHIPRWWQTLVHSGIGHSVFTKNHRTLGFKEFPKMMRWAFRQGRGKLGQPREAETSRCDCQILR